MQQVTATMPRAQLPSASELQIQNLPPFLALAASADGGREALAKTHVKLAELPFVGETGCFFPSLPLSLSAFSPLLAPASPYWVPLSCFRYRNADRIDSKLCLLHALQPAGGRMPGSASRGGSGSRAILENIFLSFLFAMI